MLVLQRKKDESIVIGGRVEVLVVEIQGGRVTLGIDAPHYIGVDRKEVHLDKQRLKVSIPTP